MGNSVSEWLARRTQRDSIEASFLSDKIGWFSVKEFGANGDGSTDDTEYIQDCMDAAATYGGVVYFPKSTGAYIIIDKITVPANVYVLGYGAEIKTSQAKTVFYIDDDAISGHDANIVFDGLKITGEQYNASSASKGIEINGTTPGMTNITIQNCEINTFGSYGIALYYGENVKIINCQIYNCYAEAIYSDYFNDNVVISNNIIRNAKGMYLNSFTHSIVSNNTLTALKGGIYVIGNSTTNLEVKGNTLISSFTDANLIAGLGQTGIQVDSTNYNINVSDNIIENFDVGIYVDGTKTGFNISNNIIKNCYDCGIGISATITGLNINSNVIIDIFHNSRSAYGIWVDSTDTNNLKGVISGNSFVKDDSTATYVMTYGIYIAETTGVQLIIGDNYNEANTYFYDAGSGLTEV